MALTNIIPPSLKNPVCELQLKKTNNPNTLGVPFNFSNLDCAGTVDIITAGITEIKRNAFGSIYNVAVELGPVAISPTNTEWNSVFTDPINNGHGNIQNVTTRVYSDFATALNNSVGANILITPLVMHDLITDQYYLFTFTQWTSGGGAPVEAIGQLDTSTYPPSNGTVVTIGTRTYTYNSGTNDWTNLEANSFPDINDAINFDSLTQVYTDYGSPIITISPFPSLGVCGNSIITTVAPVQAGFAFATPTLVGGVGGGGGFQYTRTEVVLGAVICSGRIVFDDNTWIDTAPTQNGTPFRVAMYNAAGNGLTESLIEMSPVVNLTPVNNLTGSVDCLIIGTNIIATNAVKSFAYGSNLNLQNANECFVVAHNNVTFDASGAFSCIVLGNLCTFTNGNSGVYVVGDTNTFNNVDYSAVFGQNNSITNTTFSTITGAYNVLTSSTNTTIAGRTNTVSNGSNSAVYGHNNSQVLVANYVLLGRNNTNAVTANTVNVLNTNSGLKITSTGFSGIGGIGFAPAVRFHVKGTDDASGTNSFRVDNLSGAILLTVNNQGGLSAFSTPANANGAISSWSTNSALTGGANQNAGGLNAVHTGVGYNNSVFYGISVQNRTAGVRGAGLGSGILFGMTHNAGVFSNARIKSYYVVDPAIAVDSAFGIETLIAGVAAERFTFNKDNFGVAITAPTARVHIRGVDALVNYALKVENNIGGGILSARNDGRINMAALPISNVGLIAGDLWNNAGVINIV